jgi:glutamate--cysteine ligase
LSRRPGSRKVKLTMMAPRELERIFQPAPTPRYHPLVGFEYEVVVLDGDLRPLPFEGAHGVGALLLEGAELLGGRPVEAPGDPVTKAELPGGAKLSLEPGGQLEYSSSPRGTFGGILEELERYLGLLDTLSARHGVRFFFGGVNPVHTLDEIGLVTRTRRYEIMDAYFPGAGACGRRMMRQSCSLQVTFDFASEEQGVELLVAAQLVSPFATALFANSPFVDGAPSGFASYRSRIWEDTDPSRCGLLPGFTRPGWGFADYVAHVVRAPMFFVQTEEGELVPGGGMTFADFLEHGQGGRAATLEDFALHNSTIFTDARLKQTVEVRSVDAQDPALVPSVLAFLGGILHCAVARRRVHEVLVGIDEAELTALSRAVAVRALAAPFRGRTVRELLLELIDLSAEGLRSCYDDADLAGPPLERIRRLAASGRTPADLVRERFGDDARAWLASGRSGDLTGC